MHAAPRRAILLLASLFASAAVSQETRAEDDAPPNDRLLPFFDNWFVEKGIELPRPLGVGIAAIYMDREVEVTDVRVSFGDRATRL